MSESFTWILFLLISTKEDSSLNNSQWQFLWPNSTFCQNSLVCYLLPTSNKHFTGILRISVPKLSEPEGCGKPFPEFTSVVASRYYIRHWVTVLWSPKASQQWQVRSIFSNLSFTHSHNCLHLSTASSPPAHSLWALHPASDCIPAVWTFSF